MSQHVGLHHDTCAACDEQFGDTDSCAITSTRVTDRSPPRAVHDCLDHDTAFSPEEESTNVLEDTFSYESIGVIRTPFDSPDGIPVQPVGADSVRGTVEIEE